MNRMLFNYNDILVENSCLPVDFGETQAQKDLEEFKETLIEVFNNDDDDDVVFERRTREALERVESRGIKGKPASEFLKEMDSW